MESSGSGVVEAEIAQLQRVVDASVRRVAVQAGHVHGQVEAASERAVTRRQLQSDRRRRPRHVDRRRLGNHATRRTCLTLDQLEDELAGEVDRSTLDADVADEAVVGRQWICGDAPTVGHADELQGHAGRVERARNRDAHVQVATVQLVLAARRQRRVVGSSRPHCIHTASPLYGCLIQPASWRRGVVVSGVRRLNEVNARRARLVLGWVTAFGRVYHLGM